MVRVVGVRFKKAGKVYYFDPAELPITTGAKVVVETARGVEYGEVAVGPKDVPEDQVVQPLKNVLRIGNEKDTVVAAENKRKENEAFGIAQKKIEGHALDMNLVDVEYTFDGSKIIFYFTAEGRIDFRELVRDLAGVFRTRIEMRQIGVRDEAKLLGGIGPCGRVLCCTAFLGDFAPVSIRMAKDQNLSLNPSKISGLCGRLMCCLRYEQETYEAAKKDPTLAPGYVPPVLTEDGVPELAELEDRPTPAIGFKKTGESGMSARIAQAAGITAERPQRREERPQAAERRGAPERPQGQAQGGAERRSQFQAPRPQAGGERRERPHGGERPAQAQQGAQPGQPGERRQHAPRPQQQRDRQRPQGGERPAQPQQGAQPGQPGEKRQQQPRPQHPQRDRQRPQGGERPAPQQGERPQAEGAQRQPGGPDEQNRRPHHHRGHRRRPGNPQGGQAPQGGGNSEA